MEGKLSNHLAGHAEIIVRKIQIFLGYPFSHGQLVLIQGDGSISVQLRKIADKQVGGYAPGLGFVIVDIFYFQTT